MKRALVPGLGGFLAAALLARDFGQSKAESDAQGEAGCLWPAPDAPKVYPESPATRNIIMKQLHHPALFGWSAFQEPLDLDFNSVAWVRPGGNILIDPLPLSPHDLAHLTALGGAQHVLVTNSKHLRATEAIVAKFGATVWAPDGERAAFTLPVEKWLEEGDKPVEGMRVLVVEGSRSQGELALVIDRTTLVTGDFVRSNRAGELNVLSAEQGLSDLARATATVARLAALPGLRAVLVGDGFNEYRDGARSLAELHARLLETRPG
jgi:hypothetical protein